MSLLIYGFGDTVISNGLTSITLLIFDLMSAFADAFAGDEGCQIAWHSQPDDALHNITRVCIRRVPA